MHVREVKLILTLGCYVLGVLLAEELFTLSALAPLLILLRRHQHGGVQVRIAHLGTYLIDVQRVVVFHLLTDILRESEVKGRGVKVSHLDGGCLLNAPTAVQQ